MTDDERSRRAADLRNVLAELEGSLQHTEALRESLRSEKRVVQPSVADTVAEMKQRLAAQSKGSKPSVSESKAPGGARESGGTRRADGALGPREPMWGGSARGPRETGGRELGAERSRSGEGVEQTPRKLRVDRPAERPTSAAREPDPLQEWADAILLNAAKEPTAPPTKPSFVHAPTSARVAMPKRAAPGPRPRSAREATMHTPRPDWEGRVKQACADLRARVESSKDEEPNQDTAWAAFEMRLKLQSPLAYGEIPWPSGSVSGIASSDDGRTRRTKLAAALRRWHPDKWAQILLLARESDREQILARVKQTAQRALEERDAVALGR